MSELKAKTLLWERWWKSLSYLRTKVKCKDYGINETIDSLWDKLPQASKDYWLSKI